MDNHLWEITPEMAATVNNLIKRDFANATPDEIQVYGKWSAIQAMQSEEMENHREQRNIELEQRLSALKAEEEVSLDTLKTLNEAAKAKLEAVRHGQEK